MVKHKKLAEGKVAKLLFMIIKDYTPEQKVEFGNLVRSVYGIENKIGFCHDGDIDDPETSFVLSAEIGTIADGTFEERESEIVEFID